MIECIVFENENFMAVNKPAGILSQKDKSGEPDLAAQLLADCQKQRGKALPFLAPVHRLDRNTSGMILLAKTSESARQLTAWLQAGLINRVYLAVVKGDPGIEGRYDFPLRKKEATNEVFVDPQGAPAITIFTRERKMGNSSLVRVRLLTGRSHQIRVHFAHAGHALIGDKKYAKKPWSEIFHRPALHACEIELPEYDGPSLLQAPIPEDFQGILARLSP